MRKLYFAFAILILPFVAFAEAGDTMINQTSLKQSPKIEPSGSGVEVKSLYPICRRC